MTTQQNIKVLIADDYHIFRKGIESTLRSMKIISKITEASSANEVMMHLNREPYDIVLADVKMPDRNGMGVTEIVSQKFPDTKVIAFSLHNDRENVLTMLKKNAWGYLVKSSDEEEIRKAIIDVHSGKQYFGQHVSAILHQEHLSRQKAPTPALPDELTNHERYLEVIFLVFHGFTSKEIGGIINLSDRTIENDRMEIKVIIGFTQICEFYKYVLDYGIADDEALKKKYAKHLAKKYNKDQ